MCMESKDDQFDGMSESLDVITELQYELETLSATVGLLTARVEHLESQLADRSRVGDTEISPCR